MRESEPITLHEAEKLLGKSYSALLKACQRGTQEGAVKIDGQWHIALDNSGTTYDALYEEWIDRMEKGLGYKRPLSPRTVQDGHIYGLRTFWIWFKDPPKEVKTSFKKGEERPAPKVTPNLFDLTPENLAIAISNIPINRKEQKCHFGMKEKMYKAFKSFFKLLVLKKIKSFEDLEKIDAIKFERVFEEKRKALNIDEVVSIINANEGLLFGRNKGKQDYDIALTRALLHLSACAGLRNKEIVDLPFASVDLDKCELCVVGKKSKTRIVGFNEETKEALEQWLPFRRKDSEHDNFLLQVDGRPIDKDIVYRRIKRIGNRAGLNIWPHSLRTSYATISIEQGILIDHVSNTLGHANRFITEQSYIKINKQRSIEAAKGFSLKKEEPKQKKTNKYLEAMKLLDKT